MNSLDSVRFQHQACGRIVNFQLMPLLDTAYYKLASRESQPAANLDVAACHIHRFPGFRFYPALSFESGNLEAQDLPHRAGVRQSRLPLWLSFLPECPTGNRSGVFFFPGTSAAYVNETHLAFEECSWRTRNAPKADIVVAIRRVVVAVRGADVVRSFTLPFGEAVVETAPAQHLSTWPHATPAAIA